MPKPKRAVKSIQQLDEPLKTIPSFIEFCNTHDPILIREEINEDRAKWRNYLKFSTELSPGSTPPVGYSTMEGLSRYFTSPPCSDFVPVGGLYKQVFDPMMPEDRADQLRLRRSIDGLVAPEAYVVEPFYVKRGHGLVLAIAKVSIVSVVGATYTIQTNFGEQEIPGHNVFMLNTSTGPVPEYEHYSVSMKHFMLLWLIDAYRRKYERMPSLYQDWQNNFQPQPR